MIRHFISVIGNKRSRCMVIFMVRTKMALITNKTFIWTIDDTNFSSPIQYRELYIPLRFNRTVKEYRTRDFDLINLSVVTPPCARVCTSLAEVNTYFI